MSTYKKAVTSRRLKADKASKAARAAKLYRPMPGPRYAKTEVKSLDLANASYALDSTGTVTCLNLIRAGSSFFNRIGRKVNMKSLHLKMFLNPVRTSAAPDYVRVMVVYDSQSNGAAPAISDVIQDTDQAGTNSTNAFSSANLNNRDRFRILCDYRIAPPTTTVTAGVVTNVGVVDPLTEVIDIERFIPLKGLVTQFKADSSPAVIGDIATGGLFLITYGRYASGAEGWQATGSFRLRYKDQ